MNTKLQVLEQSADIVSLGDGLKIESEPKGTAEAIEYREIEVKPDASPVYGILVSQPIVM